MAVLGRLGVTVPLSRFTSIGAVVTVPTLTAPLIALALT
jgi:hypothetical protein